MKNNDKGMRELVKLLKAHPDLMSALVRPKERQACTQREGSAATDARRRYQGLPEVYCRARAWRTDRSVCAAHSTAVCESHHLSRGHTPCESKRPNETLFPLASHVPLPQRYQDTLSLGTLDEGVAAVSRT